MRPLFIAVLLLVAGCSSGPLVRDAPDLSAPSAFPNHSAGQVLALMGATASADSLVAYSSQARVELRSPERDADLSATIRHRAADTLWASARGPFGIEVARVRATPDSFAVHDKLGGRLLVGSSRAAASFLPSPVTPTELFETLLGTLRPSDSAAWTLGVDTLGGARHYTLTSGAHRFVVDPATWRTVRYQGFADGALVDERTFSAFDRIDGRILPRRVELGNPAEEVRLVIEHRKLTLNPSSLAFPFSPGDADVRRLD